VHALSLWFFAWRINTQSCIRRACRLDYPGVGPEHSFLQDVGRAEYHSVTGEVSDGLGHAHLVLGVVRARPSCVLPVCCAMGAVLCCGCCAVGAVLWVLCWSRGIKMMCAVHAPPCCCTSQSLAPAHSPPRPASYLPLISLCADKEALQAFQDLSRLEGIIPALETSHALAYLDRLCPTVPDGTRIVLNCSGRGDKDVTVRAGCRNRGSSAGC
jgi:hypothetical protein